MTPSERAQLGNRLRAERETRHWSKPRMARELLSAADAPQSRTRITSLVRQIYDWENGQHFPRDWTTAYATAYAIPELDLFPPPPQEPGAVPTGTVDLSSTPDLGDDDVKRRAALQLITALAAGHAIPPGVLEAVLSGVEEALGNPLDLADWERTVHGYGFLINRQPLGSLINDLTADLIAVGELLKQPQDAPDKAGLLRISAGLSALLAIEFGDVGRRRAARLSWATARHSADESGDQALRVWVRAREAEEGFWAGLPPHDIDSLARQAVEISSGTPTGGLPRAYAVRASLAAEHGDTDTARTIMEKLSDVFEALPSNVTDDPATFGWGEARFRWNEAYVSALIGDASADQAVDTAVGLYPSDTLGAVANLRVIKAMGMINQREFNAGLEQTLTTLHELPVSPARYRMTGQILRVLPDQARALPAARELRALTSAT